MQHDLVQQEEQTCVFHDDMQPFREEIATLRSLAEEAGVAGPLLEELDVFKHEVEHLGSGAWERKRGGDLSRKETGSPPLALVPALHYTPVLVGNERICV